MDVRHKSGVKQLIMTSEDAKFLLGDDAANRIFNIGGKYSRTAITAIAGRKHLFLRDVHKRDIVWAIPISLSKSVLRQSVNGEGIELLKLLLEEGEVFDEQLTALAEELVELFSRVSSA